MVLRGKYVLFDLIMYNEPIKWDGKTVKMVNVVGL